MGGHTDSAQVQSMLHAIKHSGLNSLSANTAKQEYPLLGCVVDRGTPFQAHISVFTTVTRLFRGSVRVAVEYTYAFGFFSTAHCLTGISVLAVSSPK